MNFNYFRDRETDRALPREIKEKIDEVRGDVDYDHL